jgi:hypothetical protein
LLLISLHCPPEIRGLGCVAGELYSEFQAISIYRVTPRVEAKTTIFFLTPDALRRKLEQRDWGASRFLGVLIKSAYF